MDTSTLAPVALGPFLNDPHSSQAIESCKRVKEILETTSCLIVRDPRVPEEFNRRFIDLMEAYFNQPLEVINKDIFPQYSFQVGTTPELQEIPRDHTKVIEKLNEANRPHNPKGADAKWRFFWRLGINPTNTNYPEQQLDPVIPPSFPQWKEVMDGWGNSMLNAIYTVSSMLAVGFGWPINTITDRLKYGPHLLAPTGSDLIKYGNLGDILAGFHYDLNFLTIHGKSRFPGLYIWLRDGTKMLVRVPDGCLLIQAGIQLEMLTGGSITAGFHEVVVTRDTLETVEKAKKENRPTWRISSTVFSHISSDEILEPLYQCKTEENLKKNILLSTLVNKFSKNYKI